MINKGIEVVKKLLSSEIIRYIIAGGTVTVTNAVGYLLLLQLGVVYTVANIISLIVSKSVGYLMNKFFVYHSHNDSIWETFLELVRFVIARGFTGLVDFVGLIILVEMLGVGERIGKIIVMLLVMVLNYVLGKKAVFIKKKESE